MKIITFVSGKGGVGKTTTAINIAYALHSFGTDVVLVDGNIVNPNIGIYFGQSIFRTYLQKAIKGQEKIENCIFLHQSGLRFLPASISYRLLKQTKELEKKFSVLRKLKKKVSILIVDSPDSIIDSIELMKISDEVIIVVNPEISSVAEAIKLLKAARENGVLIKYFIINKVKKDIQMHSKEIEGFLGLKLLGRVRKSKFIEKSIRKNQPVISLFPLSSGAADYKKISAKLIGKSYQTREKNIFSPVKKAEHLLEAKEIIRRKLRKIKHKLRRR